MERQRIRHVRLVRTDLYKSRVMIPIMIGWIAFSAPNSLLTGKNRGNLAPAGALRR